MSSDKQCCVPGCKESGGTHKVLHLFPKPDKEPDRFNAWLNVIGEQSFENLAKNVIRKYRRVCHAHFEQKYHCRYDRLSNIAVPTLNLKASNIQTHHHPSVIREVVSSVVCFGTQVPLCKVLEQNDNEERDTNCSEPPAKRKKNEQPSEPVQECNDADPLIQCPSPCQSDKPDNGPESLIFSWQKSIPVTFEKDEEITDAPQTAANIVDKSQIKQILTDDASLKDGEPENEYKSEKHAEFSCDYCMGDIIGFRYTCVQCENYDLCRACEHSLVHPQHYMLRVPRPTKHTEIKTVIAAIRYRIAALEKSWKEHNSDGFDITEIKKEEDPLPFDLVPEVSPMEAVEDSIGFEEMDAEATSIFTELDYSGVQQKLLNLFLDKVPEEEPVPENGVKKVLNLKTYSKLGNKRVRHKTISKDDKTYSKLGKKSDRDPAFLNINGEYLNNDVNETNSNLINENSKTRDDLNSNKTVEQSNTVDTDNVKSTNTIQIDESSNIVSSEKRKDSNRSKTSEQFLDSHTNANDKINEALEDTNSYVLFEDPTPADGLNLRTFKRKDSNSNEASDQFLAKYTKSNDKNSDDLKRYVFLENPNLTDRLNVNNIDTSSVNKRCKIVILSDGEVVIDTSSPAVEQNPDRHKTIEDENRRILLENLKHIGNVRTDTRSNKEAKVSNSSKATEHFADNHINIDDKINKALQDLNRLVLLEKSTTDTSSNKEAKKDSNGKISKALQDLNKYVVCSESKLVKTSNLRTTDRSLLKVSKKPISSRETMKDSNRREVLEEFQGKRTNAINKTKVIKNKNGVLIKDTNLFDITNIKTSAANPHESSKAIDVSTREVIKDSNKTKLLEEYLKLTNTKDKSNVKPKPTGDLREFFIEEFLHEEIALANIDTSSEVTIENTSKYTNTEVEIEEANSEVTIENTLKHTNTEEVIEENLNEEILEEYINEVWLDDSILQNEDDFVMDSATDINKRSK